MENNLNDRETLGQFVDALLAQKYPGQPAKSFANEREAVIKGLDDEIASAVFGGFTPEQLNEIGYLMNNPQTSETELSDYFKNAGINLDQKIAEAMRSFSVRFLGGNNA